MRQQMDAQEDDSVRVFGPLPSIFYESGRIRVNNEPGLKLSIAKASETDRWAMGRASNDRHIQSDAMHSTLEMETRRQARAVGRILGILGAWQPVAFARRTSRRRTKTPGQWQPLERHHAWTTCRRE
ncbi:hypothetical protein E4U42_005726 [Claviceps africana]|uniref:Uncharacterized protein n=1 Tax=Claviceps africana TaxID=83212 RepID=A0A8K0J663_9HYPO|nr:hypothetical protein E4U42_005726 [Claviceps africana]